MAAVEIYTSPLCGYCHAAKQLLAEKQVIFVEVDVWAEPTRKSEMIERANGRRTVPQVFIDGEGIGGYDDLAELARTGHLDRLLGAAERPQ